ncbi:MAG: ATP-binding protein [Chitinophagales bacterium]
MQGSINQHSSDEKLNQNDLWEIVESLNNPPTILPNNIVSIVENALILAEKQSDKKLLFLLHLRFGSYWIKRQNYGEAKKHTKLALQFARECESDEKITAARINLGIICTDTNKLNDALSHLTKALDKPATHQKFNIYASIAGVYTRLERQEAALEYFEKAKNEVAYQTDLRFAGLYICTGYALYRLERYDEALKDINIAIELFKDEPAYKQEMAMCLSNLGKITFSQGIYDESLGHTQKSLLLYEELQNPQFALSELLCLAKIYLELNQLDFAYDALKKMLQPSTKEDLLQLYIQAIRMIIDVTKKMKKLKECIDYQNELIEIQFEYFYPEKKDKIEALLNKKEEKIDVLILKNQKIEKQNQQLQQYNKELEQYAFIIAHDLKEPLCNISGFTTLLKGQYQQRLNPEVTDFLQYIESGTQHMHQLLEDLLQYSTIRIDHMKVKTVALTNIIQEVFEEAKQSLSIKEAHISISDELPSLYAESKHIKWLLSQLIRNSLKFSHRDRISLIEIRSYEQNQKIFIEVKDNGIGIEKVHQQKVFRIFQRLNKEDYKVTGIGLAMCKKIVGLYDGEIDIDSEVGVGTRVYFHLPVVN